MKVRDHFGIEQRFVADDRNTRRILRDDPVGGALRVSTQSRVAPSARVAEL